MDKKESLLQAVEEVEEEIFHLVSAEASHPLFQSSLTMQQLRLLMLLTARERAADRYAGAAGQELADGLGVGLATVTGIVDRLVSRGLVRRAEDPHDRRVRRVHLADEGRRLLAEISDSGRAFRRRLLVHLDEADLENLVVILTKLRLAAHTEFGETKPL